jgi:DNA-binding MarR family transcriptional regulator
MVSTARIQATNGQRRSNVANRIRIGKGDTPTLDARLSYKVSRVHAMLVRVANPVYSRLDIEFFSARLLIFLLEHGELRVGELVELANMAQSTVSQQLKSLDKRKLIKRLRSAEDNRSVKVVLTPKGHQVAKQCNTLSHSVYRQMVEGLGPGDAQKFDALLDRVYEILVDFERVQQEAEQ